MNDFATTTASPPGLKHSDWKSVWVNRAVWIASLGYFVDVFDMVIFGVVRVESLKSLGVESDRLLPVGAMLLNLQMAGMLIGGFLWGVLGDRRGRLSVLVGSILLYSVTNLGNAFVTSLPAYAALRFLAGVGLAGELGAAITLISEILPKETRGYGTALIPTFGLSGGLAAGLIGTHLGWRATYALGGVMGLLLLGLRFQLKDSSLFHSLKNTHGTRRGDLRLLFSNRERTLRFIRCVAIGIPVWCVAGVLITFAPEFAKGLEIQGSIVAAYAIMGNYAGGVVGDLLSGILSQWLGNRIGVLYGFLAVMAVFLLSFFTAHGASTSAFYALSLFSGLANGYFSVFLSLSAEQFGTNLRATVSTSVPNLARGAVIPLTLIFQLLHQRMSLLAAGQWIAGGSLLFAVWGLAGLRETFGRDLDFLEE